MEDRIAHKPSEFSHGLVNQFVVGFGKRGGSPAFMQWLVEHPAAFGRLIKFGEDGCPKLTPTSTLAPTPSGPDLARLILGDNFISQDEMSTDFGWTYTEEQKALYEENFPTLEELQLLKQGNYPLVAGPPQDTNFLGVRDLRPKLFRIESKGWYADKNQTFAREQMVEAVKSCMVKVDVPNSRYKTSVEQKALVITPEYIPKSVEVAYVVIAFKKVRGINLLPDFYVLTSSVTSGGDHVYVGGQSGGGLSVYVWNDYRLVNVGVASARKAS